MSCVDKADVTLEAVVGLQHRDDGAPDHLQRGSRLDESAPENVITRAYMEALRRVCPTLRRVWGGRRVRVADDSKTTDQGGQAWVRSPIAKQFFRRTSSGATLTDGGDRRSTMLKGSSRARPTQTRASKEQLSHHRDERGAGSPTSTQALRRRRASERRAPAVPSDRRARRRKARRRSRRRPRSCYDSVILAGCSEVEHHEIAVYDGLIAMAGRARPGRRGRPVQGEPRAGRAHAQGGREGLRGADRGAGQADRGLATLCAAAGEASSRRRGAACARRSGRRRGRRRATARRDLFGGGSTLARRSSPSRHGALADLPGTPAEDGVAAVDDAHRRCSSRSGLVRDSAAAAVAARHCPRRCRARAAGSSSADGLWVLTAGRGAGPFGSVPSGGRLDGPGGVGACLRTREGGRELPRDRGPGLRPFTAGRPWCCARASTDAPRKGFSSVCRPGEGRPPEPRACASAQALSRRARPAASPGRGGRSASTPS